MSKLSQLAERIRSLPTLGEERARIAVARRVSEDAQSAAKALAIVFGQSPYIDLLTRGRLVTTAVDAADFSVIQAKSLKKLLQRARFGSENKISEHLDNLTKKAQALETQRNNAWARVQAEVLAVDTICDIAATLQLDSVSTLQAAAGTFRRVTASPPSSKADSDMVVTARAQNKVAITNSGLTGNVKKILEGAIVGAGEPRLLLEEDVQQFLVEHPALWSLLKLKLA